MLEEILSKDSNSFTSSHHPIIVVPSNVTPGNLCLQNAEQFLAKGEYHDGEKFLTATRMNDNFINKVTFTKNIKGKDVTFDVYDSVNQFDKS